MQIDIQMMSIYNLQSFWSNSKAPEINVLVPIVGAYICHSTKSDWEQKLVESWKYPPLLTSYRIFYYHTEDWGGGSEDLQLRY